MRVADLLQLGAGTLLVVGALAALTPDVPARAGVSPAGVCSLKKQKAFVKNVNGELKCVQRALTKGAAVEPACVAKADDALSVGFAKVDGKGTCLLTGDAPLVAGVVDRCVASVRSALGVPSDTIAAASGCAAGKLKAATKRLGAELKCHQKAVKKGAAVDDLCRLKAKEKFGFAFSVAELRGDCITSDDAAAVESLLDECLAGILDVALGRPVSASAIREAAERAVDGDPATPWSAGAFPPQWFEIDLQQPTCIERVRLRVSQSPSGHTVHTVLGKTTVADPYEPLHIFAGTTTAGQVLEYAPLHPWPDVRYLKIQTDVGPSWVAWMEIEVFAATSCGSNTPLGCGNGVLEGIEECDGAVGACSPSEACDALCRCVPTAWTCDTDHYATDDGCDCGCGIVDPDCASPEGTSCDSCVSLGSCSDPLLVPPCADIDSANNAVCLSCVDMTGCWNGSFSGGAVGSWSAAITETGASIVTAGSISGTIASPLFGSSGVTGSVDCDGAGLILSSALFSLEMNGSTDGSSASGTWTFPGGSGTWTGAKGGSCP